MLSSTFDAKIGPTIENGPYEKRRRNAPPSVKARKRMQKQ
jgi:hypothetical protein